jgi:ADP-ribose pyrophosphatase YjhB (NUDIX family)
MENKAFIRERLIKGLMEVGEKRIVGGVLIKCLKTNNVFLLYRNDKVPVWALVSGGIDEGETALAGLKREIHEELFIDPNEIEFKYIGVEHIPAKNIDFHYFEGFTNSQFKPILDHENLSFGWFPKDKLPSPLYKGLAEKIIKI